MTQSSSTDAHHAQPLVSLHTPPAQGNTEQRNPVLRAERATRNREAQP